MPYIDPIYWNKGRIQHWCTSKLDTQSSMGLHVDQSAPRYSCYTPRQDMAIPRTIKICTYCTYVQYALYYFRQGDKNTHAHPPTVSHSFTSVKCDAMSIFGFGQVSVRVTNHDLDVYIIPNTDLIRNTAI